MEYIFGRMRGSWGTWLAWSVERVILDPGVVSSNPTLGVEMT